MMGAFAIMLSLSGCSADRQVGGVGASDIQNPKECPVYDIGTELGAISSPALNEISGIVASRRYPGYFWVHNDSGDSARAFAITRKATMSHEVTVSGATAVDWEDIAIGTLGNGTSMLLFGDIGDNDEQRSSVSIYRIAEPNPTQPSTTSASAVRFEVRYPGGAKNAEALLFDEATKHAFIITKSKTGESIVYDVGDVSGASASVLATEVVRLEVGTEPLPGSPLVTAGDMSQSFVVLRTYSRAFQWLRQPGESLAATLKRAPCMLPSPDERQGEAIGLDDAGNYFTLSEGKQAVLWQFLRRP
jgi:hypothetical protein